jgi:hypothetical protein
MKTYKGEWAYVHVRLTLALGGSQRPADLPPGKLAPLFFEYDARWPQNFEVEGTSVSTGGESLFLDLILYHNPRTDCPIWRQFFFLRENFWYARNLRLQFKLSVYFNSCTMF